MRPNNFWRLEPTKSDLHYIPDAQEIAEMTELERMQEECQHRNFNDEDGCLDCGFYAK